MGGKITGMTGPYQKPRRKQRRAGKLRRRGPTPTTWIYVMKCDDHPDLVKVGFSSNPVRRAFGLRKKGALLPIVEYAKQASNVIDVERKAHQSLEYCRVHGEWFKCSVSVATTAIS